MHAIALDVTDPAQRLNAVDQAVRRFGRIDVLVNNAGRTRVGLTHALLPHMRARGGGAIVQMSSVGGQITAPGSGAYMRDEVRSIGNHAGPSG